jgi:hypothetical protein
MHLLPVPLLAVPLVEVPLANSNRQPVRLVVAMLLEVRLVVETRVVPLVLPTRVVALLALQTQAVHLDRLRKLDQVSLVNNPLRLVVLARLLVPRADLDKQAVDSDNLLQVLLSLDNPRPQQQVPLVNNPLQQVVHLVTLLINPDFHLEAIMLPLVVDSASLPPLVEPLGNNPQPLALSDNQPPLPLLQLLEDLEDSAQSQPWQQVDLEPLEVPLEDSASSPQPVGLEQPLPQTSQDFHLVPTMLQQVQQVVWVLVMQPQEVSANNSSSNSLQQVECLVMQQPSQLPVDYLVPAQQAQLEDSVALDKLVEHWVV